MNLGKLTIITPPEKLFNINIGYLLVCPSMHIKQQFQTIFSKSIDDINVFIYEENDTDIDWLLSVSNLADIVILDIDHCNQVTNQFVTFLIAQPNVHYITNDDSTPYHLISKNRIFNLDWVVDNIDDIFDD